MKKKALVLAISILAVVLLILGSPAIEIPEIIELDPNNWLLAVINLKEE